MLTSTLLASALAVAVQAAPGVLRRDSWGGALSLGPTTSHILHSTTTLIPGPAPPTQAGELFLWPGMSNGTGDLIQTTLESWPSNDWCGAVTGQWCVRASLFGSFGQLDANYSPVSGTDHVLIDYDFDATSGNWTQTVTNALTGAALSSFSYPSGRMTGWGTGTECDGGCTPTIAKQQYINTAITLASADPNFGKTLSVSQGTTYSGLTSEQGGKIWKIAEINIPSMT
ncbi:hypothetical protein MFRU_009g02390 [Monilinia fructicola]|uniref:Uncharacterized protein n=1 Tax=Monilinia fructicola TaxID=38448 RepID=A0A5M9K758_MONFR|nr:hypothetical protein EYC84_006486 [Monilinia fructicola]KAG4031466.1 hypothetical protein MFRU_009g02390 [Monilinia fructicola]